MLRLCGSYGMITNQDRLDVLNSEIEYAKSQLREHDTGHIHTSIHWMEHRCEQLRNNIKTEERADIFEPVSTMASLPKTYDELTVDSDKFW